MTQLQIKNLFAAYLAWKFPQNLLEHFDGIHQKNVRGCHTPSININFTIHLKTDLKEEECVCVHNHVLDRSLAASRETGKHRWWKRGTCSREATDLAGSVEGPSIFILAAGCDGSGFRSSTVYREPSHPRELRWVVANPPVPVGWSKKR